MDDKLGYCEECGNPIYEHNNCGPGYRDVFECPRCHHPHSRNEYWDEVPYYIDLKEMEELYGHERN